MGVITKLSHLHCFHAPFVLSTQASDWNNHNRRVHLSSSCSQRYLLTGIQSMHVLTCRVRLQPCVRLDPFIHCILTSLCEWVTSAPESVHVLRWLQICFPSRDRTCEQRGRTTATADGQLAPVTETIWRSAPLSKFIWNLHSAEMIQKMTLNWHSGREYTDELIYYDWIQHIFKLVIFYTGPEFHFMFLFSVIKNCQKWHVDYSIIFTTQWPFSQKATPYFPMV